MENPTYTFEQLKATINKEYPIKQDAKIHAIHTILYAILAVRIQFLKDIDINIDVWFNLCLKDINVGFIKTLLIHSKNFDAKDASASLSAAKDAEKYASASASLSADVADAAYASAEYATASYVVESFAAAKDASFAASFAAAKDADVDTVFYRIPEGLSDKESVLFSLISAYIYFTRK
jgi:hypothetical protein